MRTMSGILLGSGPVVVVLRAAWRLVALVAILLIATVGFALLALETARGRELACDWVFDAVSSAIPGRIVVEQCVALPPGQVRLEGIRIEDPSGRTILRARAVQADPDLWALLEGTIHIRHGVIKEPFLRLIDHGDQIAIASAFVADTEDEADDDKDEQGSDIAVVLDEVELSGGSLADLPNELSLEQIAGRTSLVWRDELKLDVRHAETRAMQGGQRLAHLSHAEGKLAFGDESTLEARASLETQGVETDVDLHFRGTMERFSTNVSAEMRDGRIEASASHRNSRLKARLRASGVHLDVFLPEVRGVAEGTLEASLRFEEPAPALDALEELDVRGDASVSRFATRDLALETLVVNARLRGRLPEPDVRATIRAEQVEVGGQTIEQMLATIEGSGGRYDVSGELPLPNGWIAAADFAASLDWPRVRLEGNASLQNAPFSPVTARFSDLWIDPGALVSVESVSIEGTGVALTAEGRYAFDEGADVTFRLRSLDLARLLEIADAPPRLEGELAGRGRFEGTIERPELDATFELRDGFLHGQTIHGWNATLRYEAKRRSAQARMQADFRENGTLSIRAGARLGEAKDPVGALRTARYDARLRIDSASVALLTGLLDSAARPEGTISADLTARGTLDTLALRLAAHGDDLTTGSMSPAEVYLRASLDDGQASARLDAATQEGTLLHAEAEARMNLRELVREGEIATVLDQPWKVSLTVPEQRLGALPWELGFPPETLGSLDASLSGGPDAMRAHVATDLRFPAGSDETASSEWCANREPARLKALLELRDGTTELEVVGYLAHQRMLHAEARAHTPVDRWIEDGWPAQWPSAQARGELHPIAMSAVPVLCAHAKGELEGQFDAADLFRPSQQIALRAEARDLVMRNEQPVDVVVRSDADAASVTAELRMTAGGQELARVDARAPIDVQQADGPVALGAGELRVATDFHRAPLSVLLGPVPGVARPQGELDGQLMLVGEARDVESWELRGDVELADASMTIEDPFLRLDEVDADIGIEPDRWVIRSLSAHDREGRIEAAGAIELAGWTPEKVDLKVKADGYPLRREGVPLATLNGQIDVRGDLAATPRVIRMELGKDVSLVLPEELRYGVQSLTQHPLVIYQGQPGFDRSLSVEEALRRHHRTQPDEEGTSPLVVRVVSSEPLWVRRPDFSIQLGVDLEVHSEEDATRIEGEVDIRRGLLVLVNKNFDIESGTIQFTGATPIDPTVDLSATHRLRTGYVVTVDFEGPVSDPEITFSSDAPGANTNAEIIALLLGVSRQGPGDDRVESQSRSVLAGLTAGLVGSLARRELGQYAPIIALESEGTAETTRVRAGVSVGDLIPESWQDVLLGVYVEGMLGGSEAGPRGGLLLELLFPHYLSTTTTYEQPDNWSLDLLWQP